MINLLLAQPTRKYQRIHRLDVYNRFVRFRRQLVAAFASVKVNYNGGSVSALTTAELEAMGNLACGIVATDIPSVTVANFWYASSLFACASRVLNSPTDLTFTFKVKLWGTAICASNRHNKILKIVSQTMQLNQTADFPPLTGRLQWSCCSTNVPYLCSVCLCYLFHIPFAACVYVNPLKPPFAAFVYVNPLKLHLQRVSMLTF